MTALKTILAGCGGMSRVWVDAAKSMPDAVELVAFVDLNRDAAAERARDYGAQNPIIETDIRTALDQIDADIVFDCTIPEAHYEITLAALEAGCHVLGEKPLAHSMQAAREMVTAAESAGKQYAVIQNRRYNKHIRRAKSFVESGALGTLTTLNSDFFLAPHFGGFRAEMDHVLLLDMAIHTFDAARYLTGADPVSVYCKEWNPAESWYAHGASAVAIFEMTGGIVYTYRGSWCAEGLQTSWEATWRVTGTNGTALWDGGERLQAQTVASSDKFFSDLNDEKIPPASEMPEVGHAAIMAEFIDCIHNGCTPLTTASDNIKSLAMVFGAIESAETGRPVDIFV